jgi:hypothetical protein
MKRNLTLALAAAMFLLTTGALPHHASASTTTATVTASTDIKGDSTDKEHKDWSEVVSIVISLLL